MKGGSKVVVEQHRHDGIFVARGKEDALVTRNMVPGESVYGEKRISVEVEGDAGSTNKVEYRVWNPFRSKVAAAILGGTQYCSDRKNGRGGWGVLSLACAIQCCLVTCIPHARPLTGVLVCHGESALAFFRPDECAPFPPSIRSLIRCRQHLHQARRPPPLSRRSVRHHRVTLLGHCWPHRVRVRR